MWFSKITVRGTLLTDYKQKTFPPCARILMCVLCHWSDTSSQRLNKWHGKPCKRSALSERLRVVDRFHTPVAHSSCWLHTSVLSGSITGDYSTRFTRGMRGRFRGCKDIQKKVEICKNRCRLPVKSFGSRFVTSSLLTTLKYFRCIFIITPQCCTRPKEDGHTREHACCTEAARRGSIRGSEKVPVTTCYQSTNSEMIIMVSLLTDGSG